MKAGEEDEKSIVAWKNDDCSETNDEEKERFKKLPACEILYLERKLVKQNEMLRNMKIQREVWKALYEKEVQDAEDIVTYLKRRLQDESMQLAKVKEKLRILQKKIQVEEESQNKHNNQVAIRLAKEEETLFTNTVFLRERLKIFADQTRDRDQQLSEFRLAEQALEAQEKQIKLELREREKKSLAMLERLRIEVDQRLQKLFEELKGIAQTQISSLVRKSQRGTEIMRFEMQDIAEAALKLLGLNFEVQEEEHHLQLELKVTKEMNDTLTLKSREVKKSALLVVDEFKARESKSLELNQWEAYCKILKSDVTKLENKLFQAKDKSTALSEQLEDQTKYIEKIEKQIEHQANFETLNLNSVIKTAEDVIKNNLMMSSVASEEDPIKRQTLLLELATLMNKAADLEFEDSVGASSESFQSSNKTGNYSSYELGLMGFICPRQKTPVYSKRSNKRKTVRSVLVKDRFDQPRTFVVRDPIAARILNEIGLAKKYQMKASACKV